jgi:hypothetical protein
VVPAPFITSVSPPWGYTGGGEELSITGGWFEGNVRVTVGILPATNCANQLDADRSAVAEQPEGYRARPGKHPFGDRSAVSDV